MGRWRTRESTAPGASSTSPSESLRKRYAPRNYCMYASCADVPVCMSVYVCMYQGMYVCMYVCITRTPGRAMAIRRSHCSLYGKDGFSCTGRVSTDAISVDCSTAGHRLFFSPFFLFCRFFVGCPCFFPVNILLIFRCSSSMFRQKSLLDTPFSIAVYSAIFLW